MNDEQLQLIELFSYTDFLESLEYYLAWAWGMEIESKPSEWPKQYRDLTGREIRQIRRDSPLDLDAIVSTMGPWQVGVRAPHWVWDIMVRILPTLDVSNPLAFNPLEYDPAAPGMRYASDRAIIKEVFCGGIDQEVGPMGTKWDGTAVGESLFQDRASRWLISVISQVAQKYKSEMELTRKIGDGLTVQTTKILEEKIDTVGKTPGVVES